MHTLKVMAAVAAISVFFSAEDVFAGSFPVITAQAQRDRDNDRKTILNNELIDESAQFKAAETQLAVAQNKKGVSASEIKMLQEDVSRHRSNIEALEREIALVGASPATRQVVKLQTPAHTAAAKPKAQPVMTAPSESIAVTQNNGNTVPWWDAYRRPQTK